MELQLSDTMRTALDGLSDAHGDQVVEIRQSSSDTFVRVKRGAIVEVCRTLKEELGFIYLSDIFAVDRFTSEERFEVVYNLVSLKDRLRLFVKIRLEEENPEADSVYELWPSADWFEREVYDMFGVRFRGHPDLRRIYMPEDYDYFPMRKEFPLLGIPGSIELPSTTPDTE
ncbi:MAG: NADH-quinone oxidoreductase subunit C [Balneolaceae bacterium]|nr:NADH-quinone oxidoreductase subunit C [Balneolaceae bacterium]